MTRKNYEYKIGEIYLVFLTMKKGTFINMPPFGFKKKFNAERTVPSYTRKIDILLRFYN
jgi:hypothetical protein